MKTNTKLVYTYTQENVIICGTSALKPNVEVTLHQETLSLTKKAPPALCQWNLNFSLRHSVQYTNILTDVDYRNGRYNQNIAQAHLPLQNDQLWK